jgi:hypothetical protein
MKEKGCRKELHEKTMIVKNQEENHGKKEENYIRKKRKKAIPRK